MDHQTPQPADGKRYVQEGNRVNLRHHNAEDANAIVHLFTSVFATSEGEAEGALIGKLAADLLETPDDRDLFNYVAVDSDCVVASIFFTRLEFDNKCDAFILAPVAVRSDRQREGIGQALIGHGLNDLRERGVDFVLTYGDPDFYQKVGFQQISPTTIRAPFRLSQPEGWLGQSLGIKSIETLTGTCACVNAFNDPVYW
ncbi:Acetyltransferase (GNAT) family protein [Rubinisphaera italica]|uniref:Acetyltransferase (GNAT) family protein n=1 Tax=Rubinisphaera italica TaxID=2527969 RepID=A0A5C5XFF2_9PLAN|nr:Acetyltransferase (GNAT) family protein [Rubinisphaera italica]